MPFTPYHLSLPLILYAIYRLVKLLVDFEVPTISWLTITAGSVIADTQGIFYLLTRIGSLHGFSHTLVGAMVYSLIYSMVLVFIDKLEMVELRLRPIKIQLFILFFSINLFHIIPDMLIYSGLHIFWPFADNSYGDISRYSIIAGIMANIFLVAVLLLMLTLIVNKIKDR